MNDSRPLVSIGIPTFNRPESLRRSLSCICQQIYPKLEIIVSDNASPGEETERVVREYMAWDGRIQYTRQPTNLGPVANFQFVLDAATGEYFMWMSDDDWRAPTYIEALLRVLQDDKAAILAFCDIAVLDEKGNRRSDFYRTYLPYLRPLAASNAIVRLARFFLQDENLGKANLVYGLMRSEAIKAVPVGALYEKYGFYGLDNLILFELLGKGRLRLVEDMLYGCTSGNVKHYPVVPDATALKGRMYSIGRQLRYLLAYPRLSKGMMKIILTTLFPLKLIMFYFHISKRKLSITSNPALPGKAEITRSE